MIENSGVRDETTFEKTFCCHNMQIVRDYFLYVVFIEEFSYIITVK